MPDGGFSLSAEQDRAIGRIEAWYRGSYRAPLIDHHRGAYGVEPIGNIPPAEVGNPGAVHTNCKFWQCMSFDTRR